MIAASIEKINGSETLNWNVFERAKKLKDKLLILNLLKIEIKFG